MKLYQNLTLKFERPDWANNPKFGLMDSILEKRPDQILKVIRKWTLFVIFN
ncbi:MAG TPA: hypothetical protein VFD35_07635 [Pricia sp.]|nr:hypothetical protein [Pricia sp.]